MILPRLTLFDLTSYANNEAQLDLGALAQTSAYGLLYTAALLAIACARFTKRDIF